MQENVFVVHRPIASKTDKQVLVFAMGTKIERASDGAADQVQQVGMLMSAEDARRLADELLQALNS